jgi:quercetin dioxygenase-like cupin family protein
MPYPIAAEYVFTYSHEITKVGGQLMSTPVSVTKLETKKFDSPDEVRSPSKTRVEIVRLEGFTLGRFNFEPGWRWSECVKPVVKTETCQVSHVGYVVSGRITIQMKDGTKKTISAGESYSIPAGHDAWVEGNERFVAIEVMSAEQYAKA